MKHKPLDGTKYGKPEQVILDFLDDARAGRDASSIRVLDVGCGRGSRVAWLCEAGWDAWGTEIDENYLASGRPFFREREWDPDRLRVGNGTDLPFDADTFDVVLSDQVIEHVRDLDGFAAGIARVSRPGAIGMHVFPATWRPVEPHLRQPLVHWLPKGPSRHAAIYANVRAGVGVRHFANLGAREQARIYSTFSDEETYYRLRRTVAEKFEANGMTTDFRTAALAKTRYKLGGRLPSTLIPLASMAYSLFLQTYFTTVLRVDFPEP